MEHQFLSGGYYLTRPANRGSYISAKLIPERILSASSCICQFFPDTWAIQWTADDQGERKESAAAFQIPPEKLDRIIQWATDSFEKLFGWPNVFYSLEAAMAARSEFLPKDLDVTVFGLGLHRDDAGEFLKWAKPPSQIPGYSPQGEKGIYQCINARNTIAVGGRQIGFELLSLFVGQLDHSWLCNGLETVCDEKLNVRPNEYGFIAEYSDAKRCTEYISRGEVGAEPGLWKPWLITLYSA
jgi:hypothetical protein